VARHGQRDCVRTVRGIYSADPVAVHEHINRQRFRLCVFGNRQVRLCGFTHTVESKFVHLEAFLGGNFLAVAFHRDFVEIRKLAFPERVEVGGFGGNLHDFVEVGTRAAVEEIEAFRLFAVFVDGSCGDSNKSRNID